MKFREMVVDLTPLLDVILIILFMVITTHNQSSEETIQALQEDVQQLEQTQLPQTQSEATWMRTYQESIGKINIVYEGIENESGIHIIHENGNIIHKAPAENLLDWLQSEISSIDKDVIIVAFTYNSEEIYNQEYRNVLRTVTELDQILEQTIVYREEDWQNNAWDD